jgi:hypothetical protein
MAPVIHIHFTPVIIAVFSSFFLGFLWYSVFFRRSWQKAMGYTEPMQVDTKKMIQSLVLNLIGTFLMVWVFAHNIAAWNPKTWGIESSFMSNNGAAISAALFTWVGFYVPQDFNKVAFQMRSWQLFFIDTSFNLLSLFIAAFVLVYLN